jgi:Tol biopolymer transport system component
MLKINRQAWLCTVICLTLCADKIALAQNSVEELNNSKIAVAKITPLRAAFKNIESIAWSKNGQSLLIDRQGLNQFYQVVLAPVAGEGTNGNIVTANRDGGSRNHNGNPSWHPDNKHIVFCGQNAGSTEFTRSAPSHGLQCNLWFGTSSGSQFWQLTHLQTSFNSPKGVSMPRFSPNGKTLFWTGCLGATTRGSFWGERALFLADFSFEDERPQLSNQQHFQPGAQHDFYESYGFSPDGKSLLFAGNMSSDQQWFGMDICKIQFANNHAAQAKMQPVLLTKTPHVWDRYASFSPKGNKIIWSSSEGNTVPYLGIGGARWQQFMQADLWIMNSDGSDKKRLTGFNNRLASEYTGRKCYVGMSAWHPHENKIALVLHYEIRNANMESIVHIIELNNIDKMINQPAQ